MPNNQIVISINNPSPMIHPQPQGFRMQQKVQTPFIGILVFYLCRIYVWILLACLKYRI